MIKVTVRDITSKGLDLNQVLLKESIGLSDEEIDVRDALNITAHLHRVNNTIVADVHVKADIGSMCSRCLQDMHQVQEFDYHFDFEVDPKIEYVDLGEEIRQELIMAAPAKLLCKDDCKGMCPNCGIDLNVEQCKCKKPSVKTNSVLENAD